MIKAAVPAVDPEDLEKAYELVRTTPSDHAIGIMQSSLQPVSREWIWNQWAGGYNFSCDKNRREDIWLFTEFNRSSIFLTRAKIALQESLTQKKTKEKRTLV